MAGLYKGFVANIVRSVGGALILAMALKAETPLEQRPLFFWDETLRGKHILYIILIELKTTCCSRMIFAVFVKPKWPNDSLTSPSCIDSASRKLLKKMTYILHGA